MPENLDHTMKFDSFKEEQLPVNEVIKRVYEALEERGYEPVNQIVGYILSGDPTYITSHNDARKLIRQLERDDLLTVVLKAYIESEAIGK